MRCPVVFLVLFQTYLLSINAKDLQNEVTTSPTPSATLQRSATKNINAESESLTKRGIKESDLSAASAKSYDPPPEFYRGPGSTGHISSTQEPLYNNHNYKPYHSFKSRPITFPDTHSTTNNNNKQNGDDNGDGKQDGHLASSWQHLKEKVGGLLNKNSALHDRVSVAPSGQYGLLEHGSSSTNGGGYAYEGRPHAEYPHYGGSVGPLAHTSGFYGGHTTAEGIPFDVYGNQNHYSGSAGNEYASHSYSEITEPATHKTHPNIAQKVLLAKSFLIPLASAAVLGIAAALVSNPLLLQLGTVSGVGPGTAILGKRKRRDLTTTSATPNDTSTNGLNFILNSVKKNEKDSQLQPYRGHHQQ